MIGLRVKLGFNGGSLEYYSNGSSLAIKALDNTVELRPRSIFIEEIDGYEEGSTRRRKYIYIYPLEPLKPLPQQPMFRVHGIGRASVRGFQVNVTDTPIGFFHTVLLPGYYLYDYMILTDDQIAISLSPRRKAYFDKEGKQLTVYLV